MTEHLSEVQVRERVKVELREIRQLLEGAEQIADGLVALCDHAYNHDHRTKDALRAANAAAVAISLAKVEAEHREDDTDEPGQQATTYGATLMGDSSTPQFWESGPTTDANRVYFTAESNGRVIAGGSGTGATLTSDQVKSLAEWLEDQDNAPISVPDPLSASCPECRAPVGAGCRSYGTGRARSPHDDRVERARVQAALRDRSREADEDSWRDYDHGFRDGYQAARRELAWAWKCR